MIDDSTRNEGVIFEKDILLIKEIDNKTHIFLREETKDILTKKGYPTFGASDEELINMLNDLNKCKHEASNYRYVSRLARYSILKRQGWTCNICGCKLRYSNKSQWGGETAHIDHIHPFSKRFSYPNGSDNINEISNLQALCPECNLTKSKKEIN